MQDQFWDIYYSLKDLCYAFCGIFGLVAALRIYKLWNVNNHHVEITSEILAWAGAAVFFLAAALFIETLL